MGLQKEILRFPVCSLSIPSHSNRHSKSTFRLIRRLQQRCRAPNVKLHKSRPPASKEHPSINQSTAKRSADLPTPIRIHNLLDRDIHARHTNEPARGQSHHVHPRHRPPAPPRRHATLIVINIKEPERARDAVGVPAREQARRDADQVIEDGHPDREHERRGVHDEDEQHPSAPAQDGVRVQVPRSAEEAHEEQFRRRVAVERAGDQEIRDGDAVGCFGPFGREGGEGGGGDVGAEVEVGDDGEEDVEARGEDLEHVGGAHGVLGVAHLRDQDEEHEVPGIGEDGVRDADEGGDATEFSESVFIDTRFCLRSCDTSQELQSPLFARET